MPDDTFDFKVYTNNVHVQDENGEITTPDRVQTRSPCALNRGVCPHHRDQDHPTAPLPAPSKHWTTKLKRKAKGALSGWNARPPKPNKDLVIICKDFRCPVVKRSHRLTVLIGLARPACCLLIEVQVKWLANRQAEILEYLAKIYEFVRHQRGTVAIEFKLKLYLEGGERTIDGHSWIRDALAPDLGMLSKEVRHVDISAHVEQQVPPRIKIWRFKGLR
ncbi:hypothetical protein BKA81DRAFT_410233 [Phyllosticta paracitricarpa]|uniref:Uncharacterized protein n=1 Tax=Phyllosticta paracitricarpa TaxID=2016321 RepID=A0ABR1MVB1_9PEZI